jgi:hypothetical protein
MKWLKRLGLLLAVLGLILYTPVMTKWLTLYFGDTLGQFSGPVSFGLGWAVFGACLAFSAGQHYGREKIK